MYIDLEKIVTIEIDMGNSNESVTERDESLRDDALAALYGKHDVEIAGYARPDRRLYQRRSLHANENQPDIQKLESVKRKLEF